MKSWYSWKARIKGWGLGPFNYWENKVLRGGIKGNNSSSVSSKYSRITSKSTLRKWLIWKAGTSPSLTETPAFTESRQIKLTDRQTRLTNGQIGLMVITTGLFKLRVRWVLFRIPMDNTIHLMEMTSKTITRIMNLTSITEEQAVGIHSQSITIKTEIIMDLIEIQITVHKPSLRFVDLT